MAAQTYPAPAPQISDQVDGRYRRWRFEQALADVGDCIRLDVGDAREVTLTLLELVDGAAPTVTTFQPQLGTADDFVLDSIDGRTSSPTADAPSRSQTPVMLDAQLGSVVVRPVPSAPCTVQIVATIREGHRT